MVTEHSQEISAWTLASIGAVVTIVCFFFMVRVLLALYRSRASGIQPTNGAVISLIIQCALPWGPLARTIELFIVAAVRNTDLLFSLPENESFVEIFLSSLPGYIYISVYLLLLLFWIRLNASKAAPQSPVRQAGSLNHATGRGYGAASASSASRLNQQSDDVSFKENVLRLWAIFTAALFLIWVVLLMLMAAMPNKSFFIHQIEAGYSTTLSCVIALMFAVWMGVVINKLTHSETNPTTAAIGKKIVFLTGICVIVFLLRAAIIIVETFVETNTGLASFIFVVFFFMICEFFPPFLLLLIIHWPTAGIQKPADSSVSYQTTVDRFQPEPELYFEEDASFISNSDSEHDYHDEAQPLFGTKAPYNEYFVVHPTARHL